MDTPWIIGQRVQARVPAGYDESGGFGSKIVGGTVDYVTLGIVTDEGETYEVRSEEVVSI